MLEIETPSSPDLAPVHYEIYDWLVSERLEQLNNSESSNLQDFLQMMHRNKQKLLCQCRSDNMKPIYSTRHTRNGYRLSAMPNSPPHDIGCQLASMTVFKDESAINNDLPQLIRWGFLADTEENLSLDLGLENNVIDRWLNQKSRKIWQPHSIVAIGYSLHAYYELLDKLRDRTIAFACIVGRFSKSKHGIAFRFPGTANSIFIPVHGKLLDLTGPTTVSAEKLAMCVIERNQMSRPVATFGAMVTMTTSGWPLIVKSQEIRWAQYTLAHKLGYAREKFNCKKISAAIRYDNGLANPSAFVLSNTVESRIIPIRIGGEIVVPEVHRKDVVRTQFVVKNENRKSRLSKRNLTKAHMQFKAAVLAHLDELAS